MRHIILGLALLANLLGCQQEWEARESNDAPDVVAAIEAYNLEKYAGLWRIERTSGAVLELELSKDGYNWQLSSPNAPTRGDYGRIRHMPDELTLISHKSECKNGSGKGLRYVFGSQLVQNELEMKIADSKTLRLSKTDVMARMASIECPALIGDDIQFSSDIFE